MNKLNVRNGKKGVTPVIATIILIAGTLVLALVVGAYTFGLFGSNVKTIQLNSATLFGGATLGSAPATTSACPTTNAYMTLSLNNPGALTSLSSVTITGSSNFGTIASVYAAVGSGDCNTLATAQVAAGAVTSLTLVFVASGSPGTLLSGQTFNYVINFGNGQSVSGSLVAQ